MSESLRHQLEWALKANQRNAETLNSLLEIQKKLEPEGWTPDIYAHFIKELQRVQMCVVHRHLIIDILSMMDSEVETDHLPSGRFDDDDDSFTRRDFDRIRERLETSLSGLPPT